MSAVPRRDARSVDPEPPTGQLQVEPPPQLPEDEGSGGILVNAIPMLGSVGTIALVAGLGTHSGNSGRSLIAAATFLVATLGFVCVQVDRQRRQRRRQVGGPRTAYLLHLGDVRTSAREAAALQRTASRWHHPEPSALPALAEERSRVWSRGPTDARFLQLRLGLSRQPLSLALVAPDLAVLRRVDPVAASALQRLLAVHRKQQLPASADLRAFDAIELGGPADTGRRLARAMICSATAFQSPEHLLVAVLTSRRLMAHWDWVKWLPHHLSAREVDAVGPRRMAAETVEALLAMLPLELVDRPFGGTDVAEVRPHLLLVLDDAPPAPPPLLRQLLGRRGVTVLDLGGQWEEPVIERRLRLELTSGTTRPGKQPVRILAPGAEPVYALADQCQLATAEAFARRLTPLLSGPAGHKGPAAGTGALPFMELLGLGDVHSLDPRHSWRSANASPRERLRVPIGLDDFAGTVHLDLKESAHHGMGPHGLVVGATGSGKSEFLRTLVLGLALTHSPEHLNLVLVDFKGGATFAGMTDLPQVSAVITNLAEELTLVDRMQDALSGELVRRQELLRGAGNLQSIHDYETARRNGADLQPLPSLVIVVDEFSELLSAKPEFLDLFVAIGRLGRSLGLHLLLASQQLEEGRLRGLESHLSYRVGLRTFSAAESRAVLGVPDAFELPASPGLGFLKASSATPKRFRSGYVSGPARRTAAVAHEADSRPPGILPFTITEVEGVVEPARRPAGSDQTPPPGMQPSLLEVAVTRLAGHGPVAHQVWLPPLDVPETLDSLMPDLASHPALGLVSKLWRARGGLVVPLGMVDRPREQRREVLTVDLRGAAGNVAVVGGPRSGKSTLLRTLVTALALTTTPQESQFYVLDFGGGTFSALAELPHVAGIATRAEPEVVRRVVADVSGIAERREAYFARRGIDSIENYRSLRASGQADDGYGELFVLVDGWSALRSDHDDLETELQTLAARGLGFGVHLVVGASRWADLRAATRDLFGTRLELRLGDPLDSEVDRRAAATVPLGRPGRGLLPSGLHFLAALPRLEADADPATLGSSVVGLVMRSRDAWVGPPGPKLRLLPKTVELSAVRARAAALGVSSKVLVLGVDERELAPVTLDTRSETHLLAFGDTGSGKSTLLRTLCHEISSTHSPQEAQIVVVDYRRSLLGEVPTEHLLTHLTSTGQAAPAIQDLATYLRTRIPGPEVTPAQLRHRDWWPGSEVFVVVDDYDLVSATHPSPLTPLIPLLAQARDVGLHLLLARHSGGAARAAHEPVVQALRELAAPGLLLSGNPDEGQLIGRVRADPAPAGRAKLITRERGLEIVQIAWTPQIL